MASDKYDTRVQSRTENERLENGGSVSRRAREPTLFETPPGVNERSREKGARTARNREGFRSIISYGDVLDGNGRGCRSSRPCSPRFSTVRREEEEEEGV